MSDYIRSTRECAFNQVQPALYAAIRQHAEENQLGNLEAKALACVETRNERKRSSGLFSRLLGSSDPDPLHYTAAVVTPKWLIWASSGAKRGTTVLSARLTDVQVRNYDMNQLVEDSGLVVNGLLRGATEKAEAFIGLGPEPAAEDFKRIVREAIEQANG
jgi:hypothetical protein